MRTINEFLEEGKLGEIDITYKDLERIAEQVLDPLIAANTPDPVLYRHGDAPVWIVLDDNKRPKFREITLDRMRLLLARKFSWYRFNRNDHKRPACPPIEVVRDLLAFPNIDLPVVERIVSVPVVAPDGTIQLEAGYCPATRCVYLPCDGLAGLQPVSDSPDSDEVAYAVWLFQEFVVDFPFVGHGRTHTLAALLLPFVRAVIKGPTPLHLFEKPEAGTGATLLVELIGYIVLGHSIPTITEAHNTDEFTRKIHSTLRAGPTAVFLDNLRTHVNSVALVVALTNELFADRIVGRSEIEAVPIGCLWMAGANNPSLSREMVRRTIPIRMDAQMENPHLRTDFRNPGLREWVKENHALLVWAMLTLIRAWFAAGCPKGARKLGKYESYCEVIGGILDVAGVPGFLDFPEEQSRLEDDETDLAPLIPLWQAKFGFNIVSTADLFGLQPELDLGGKTDIEQKIRLGKLLRTNRDRRFGDVAIVDEGERGGSRLWRLAQRMAGHPFSGQGAEPARAEGVGELGESLPPSKQK